MKKYWLALIMFIITLMHGNNVTHAQSSKSQKAVEQGLRPLVKFSDEPLKTFTVEERLQHFKVPGISFALIDNWQLAWVSAYGTLSAESITPVTTDTIFQAASIAKPVTAFGVMRMQDKAAIDINAPIDDYLTTLALPKGKQSEDAKVTFKNILDHTSGLTPGGYAGYEKGELIPSDEQTFLGQSPATNKPVTVEEIPGTEVRYSGGGYTLAEIVLHDEFKQSFEKTMRQWVLTPLSMDNSAFELDYPNAKNRSVALGHDNLGKTIEGGWRVHPEQAAAGLWSTPTDLAKFALEVGKAYHGKSKLLSKAAAREMLAPVMPNQDLSSDFGGQPAMTFVISGTGQNFLFNHGGGTIGYRCLLVFYPEMGKGAVFMTNSDVGYGVGVEMLRAASAVYEWPHYKGETFVKRKVEHNEQSDFLGIYAFDSGWQVEIIQTSEADGIAIKFPNQDVYPLTGVEGEHHYVHRDTGVEASFRMISGTPELSLYGQTAKQRQ